MDKSDPSIDKDMEMNAEGGEPQTKAPKVISVATIKSYSDAPEFIPEEEPASEIIPSTETEPVEVAPAETLRSWRLNQNLGNRKQSRRSRFHILIFRLIFRRWLPTADRLPTLGWLRICSGP